MKTSAWWSPTATATRGWGNGRMVGSPATCWRKSRSVACSRIDDGEGSENDFAMQATEPRIGRQRPGWIYVPISPMHGRPIYDARRHGRHARRDASFAGDAAGGTVLEGRPRRDRRGGRAPRRNVLAPKRVRPTAGAKLKWQPVFEVD